MQPPRLPPPGLPWPHKRGSSQKSTAEEPQAIAYGVLEKIDAKTLVLAADDTRIITYQLSDKTKFLRQQAEMKPSELKAGDRLEVAATEDNDGYLHAVTVRFQKAGPATTTAPPASQAQPAASSAPAPATIAAAADATLPPVTVNQPLPNDEVPHLKRGKPPKRASSEPDETVVASTALPASQTPPVPPPAPTPPQPSPIDRAREAASQFTQSLPNYVCQEVVTRYQSDTHPTSWTAQDVVTAVVVYEDGKESYRNLTVGGRPVKKDITEISGTWSTGEFGTILLDLFHPATAAEFIPRGSSRIEDRSALLYDFRVTQPHSHWHIQQASQAVEPAYRGSVWIDKETYRTLRIEMQAVNLPPDFPIDTTETAIDYASVRIGEHEYLVPVRAETLGCVRGAPVCMRNVIEFRNYKRFTGEADIVFH